MRLNGWQRIGVLLSIAWMIGAAIHTRNNEVEVVTSLMHSGYRHCYEMGFFCPDTSTLDACLKANHEKKEACSEKVSKEYAEQIANIDWPNIAFMSIAPVITGWIVAYLLLWAFLWIRRGFNRNQAD